MIASLMMYQRLQLVNAHFRYWALIRSALAKKGIDSPNELSQDAEEFYVWRHPNLVLSQTCGMPYRTWLHKDVHLVGTPDYGLDGCKPGYYKSAIIVRADDSRKSIDEFENAVFAYNQTMSQSGYTAAYWHVKPHEFWFKKTCHSGQHLLSARMVANANADITSLDAVSWRNIKKYEAFAKKLRVLDWTEPTPGLPLITSKSINAVDVFDAVETAIHELTVQDQSDLGFVGLVKIPKSKYLDIKNPDLPECQIMPAY